MDGLDAAAGERGEPIVDAAGRLVVDADVEEGDAGADVGEEDAVDDRGVRAEGEGEGEYRERLPEVAPGAGEHGGAHGVPEVEADEDLVPQLRREGGEPVGPCQHPLRLHHGSSPRLFASLRGSDSRQWTPPATAPSPLGLPPCVRRRLQRSTSLLMAHFSMRGSWEARDQPIRIWPTFSEQSQRFRS